MNKKINKVEILTSLNKLVRSKDFDFKSLTKFIFDNNIYEELDVFFKCNLNITEKDIRALKLSEKALEIIEMFIIENDISLDNDLDCVSEIDFSDNKQILMSDIRRTSLLDNSEVNRLVILAQKGDVDAKNRLINSNLRLVFKITKDTCRNSDEFLDSFQNGCSGLIRAIEKYNPSMNCKFSTYAVFWIRSFISRGFVELKNGIVLSYQGNALLKRINAIKSEFFNDNGYAIDDEKLASILASIEIKKNKTRSFEGHKKYFMKKINEFNMINNVISLDSNISDSFDVSSGNKKINSIADNSIDIENDTINSNMISSILDIIDSELPSRQAEIIKMKCGFYNGREISFVEIAKHYGVTYQYISKVYHQAIDKLRENEKIKQYM